MSDANAFAFGKFIPGFEFLQQLASAQKAGSAMPGLGQWVAPTVSLDELDKRISELKAVLFWLDQNATALKATIQALEVQKMTLATLQGMNVSMSEVAKAFTAAVPTPAAPAPTSAARTPAPAPGGTAPSWPFVDQPTAEPDTPAPSPEPEPVADSAPEAVQAPAEQAGSDKGAPVEESSAAATSSAASASAAARMADGMQWWNALTQQFQQIAASALREAVPPKAKADAGAAAGTPQPPAAAKAAAKAAKTAKAPKAARPKGAAKKAASPKSAPQRPSARSTAGQRAAAKKGAKAEPSAAASKKAPAKKAAPARAASREAAPARQAGGWPLPPPAKRR
ncbi:PhaM family polyhydroxyalkanoate granule multifunctional regulatory protein [Ottowia oryzae]|uniref:Uncharacterized protein n=1 Tax=Ottowia oryzae TaxID=2109914 RepID=A0A2S0MDE3_9BURK|nr:PhaM family polyhydroxyalkanoate granule multifunctional regulatory protein [Ottowia oryzae]AVO33781.1 hypothetical protein C6570_05550 [Ottowia oryzae]